MTTDEIMELALVFRNAEYFDASQQASFDLKTAIEALQADAARYRWLRNETNHTNANTMVVNENIGHDWARVMDLDKAIDAAMAAEKATT